MFSVAAAGVTVVAALLTLRDSEVESARATEAVLEALNRATEWRIEERPNIVKGGNGVVFKKAQ